MNSPLRKAGIERSWPLNRRLHTVSFVSHWRTELLSFPGAGLWNQCVTACSVPFRKQEKIESHFSDWMVLLIRSWTRLCGIRTLRMLSSSSFHLLIIGTSLRGKSCELPTPPPMWMCPCTYRVPLRMKHGWPTHPRVTLIASSINMTKSICALHAESIRDVWI